MTDKELQEMYHDLAQCYGQERLDKLYVRHEAAKDPAMINVLSELIVSGDVDADLMESAETLLLLGREYVRVAQVLLAASDQKEYLDAIDEFMENNREHAHTMTDEERKKCAEEGCRLRKEIVERGKLMSHWGKSNNSTRKGFSS